MEYSAWSLIRRPLSRASASTFEGASRDGEAWLRDGEGRLMDG